MGLKVSDEELNGILKTTITETADFFKDAMEGNKQNLKTIRHWMNTLKIEANARLRQLRKEHLDSFRNVRDIKNMLLTNNQTRFRSMGELKDNLYHTWDEFNLMKRFLNMRTSNPQKARESMERQKAYLEGVMKKQGYNKALKYLNGGKTNKRWMNLLDFLHSNEVEDLIGMEGDSSKVVEMIADFYQKAPEKGIKLIGQGIDAFMRDKRFNRAEGNPEDYLQEVYNAKY